VLKAEARDLIRIEDIAGIVRKAGSIGAKPERKQQPSSRDSFVANDG